MKMFAVTVGLFLASFQGNAQDDFFLKPIGKKFSEYRDSITCVSGGAEFGQSYTEKSTCLSYRFNSSDSFRFDKVVFYTMFFFRDSGKIINGVSFLKSIKDEKRSKQVRRANEEFRLMTEYLNNFCGSKGKVPDNLPQLRDQKYKEIIWRKESLRFALQQVDIKVDIKKGKGFSSLTISVEKLY